MLVEFASLVAICTLLSAVLDVVIMLETVYITWGTGIRWLMRGMATLPQGNQELLVVRHKAGRPQVSLG